MKRRIIEAGHYYKVIGPTEFTKKGRDLMIKIVEEEEKIFEKLTGKPSCKADPAGLVYDSWHDEGHLSDEKFKELYQLEKEMVSSTMLFVDDVHGWDKVPKHELTAERWEAFRGAFLYFDFFVEESSMIEKKEVVLEMLASQFRNKLKCTKRGSMFCSGIKLIHENKQPTCILLDVALTLHKKELGYQKGLNILPKFYEDQQKMVQKIVGRILPEFELETMFF